MSIEEDLLRKGYLPENLPPAFSSDDVANSLSQIGPEGWWSNHSSPVRSAVYSASKRGLTRRTFSLVHPDTSHDLAKFVSTRWEACSKFFSRTTYSLSVPQHTEDGDRAIAISSHTELETVRLTRLSQYRFIAKTDISRFYHSIYTHSLPWAFHGKQAAKAVRDPGSEDVFFNRADYILRCGQDGQTIGIPVGPDVSRVLAETVSAAIDVEFTKRCDVDDFALIRHVDDIWIGANSHADAERLLWRYREAIRGFELDINENKTKIYSSDFRFTDRWPTELSTQLENAIESRASQSSERLRAAFEQAFLLAVDSGDDAVLKYVIRFLDRSDSQWTHWKTIEPFLRRAVVHFGHTMDYVARVLVWRHLAKGDLSIDAWSKILTRIIDQHGRLGNDSEVCWAIYACIRLGISINREAARNILVNCGALSIVALLNCIDERLVERSVFEDAHERIKLEKASGPFWPVLMEWRARRWPKHRSFKFENDTVGELANRGASFFDADKLPSVFANFEEADFGDVPEAIEQRTSVYDEDTNNDDDDESPF